MPLGTFKYKNFGDRKRRVIESFKW